MAAAAPNPLLRAQRLLNLAERHLVGARSVPFAELAAEAAVPRLGLSGVTGLSEERRTANGAVPCGECIECIVGCSSLWA